MKAVEAGKLIVTVHQLNNRLFNIGQVAAAGSGFPAVRGNFKWNRSSRSCVRKV
jgi:hypothetical protein